MFSGNVAFCNVPKGTMTQPIPHDDLAYSASVCLCLSLPPSLPYRLTLHSAMSPRGVMDTMTQPTPHDDLVCLSLSLSLSACLPVFLSVSVSLSLPLSRNVAFCGVPRAQWPQ